MAGSPSIRPGDPQIGGIAQQKIHWRNIHIVSEKSCQGAEDQGVGKAAHAFYHIGRRDGQKNRDGQHGLAVLLVTVLAAVDFLFFISQIEDMGKLLLHGCDAPGILAVDHVDKTVGKA